MKIEKFTTNIFQENCYLVWNEQSKHGIVIDPGMMNDSERAILEEFISKNHITIQCVLLTHTHLDHAASAKIISQKYDCKIYGSAEDEDLSKNLQMQADFFQLKCTFDSFKIDCYTSDLEELDFANLKIVVLFTPGHTKGGTSYYFPQLQSVFVGDTLFSSSIGRTDLWGGDYDTLISSIKCKIMALPGDTIIYPGHGTKTTVNEEKQYNPFLK